MNNLKKLVEQQTCYTNQDRPSGTVLIPTDYPESLQTSYAFKKGPFFELP